MRLASCGFFFSSRRRHTRYWRDWSSDVCSSDLCVAKERGKTGGRVLLAGGIAMQGYVTGGRVSLAGGIANECLKKIGRASCRERVEISVVDGELKTKCEGKYVLG